jgi:hypothetical protein
MLTMAWGLAGLGEHQARVVAAPFSSLFGLRF